tara:strand:- start:168 stop:344 length:177 start_codon:yes stop_codon:yes gene_type:complete
MQTYLIHWQFPYQEAHKKGADVFGQYVESSCESLRGKWMGECKSIRSQSLLKMVTALV